MRLIEGSVRMRSGLLAVIACGLTLASCSTGPCPKGQEIRQEWYQDVPVLEGAQIKRSNLLKARGCVGRNADGTYHREGRWEFFDFTGKKVAEGEYKNGLVGRDKSDVVIHEDGREGRWILWFEDGTKGEESTYLGGKLEGARVIWHDNGQKDEEATYRDGKLEGKRFIFDRQGQKSEEATYRDGKLEGVVLRWHDNGQRASEFTYRDGKLEGPAMEWWENGQKRSESAYRDDKLQGPAVEWDQRGKKRKEVTYRDGEVVPGTLKEWLPWGDLK
jgi:antitoxin component YwqK of YwqJK toxin-antitoxin module